MNKKKKRTTRAAKLSGILVGFGAWTLIILISLTIAIFFLKVFGVRILENDVSIIIFMVLWFLLGPITAITFGRFVTFRWAGYPNKKKFLINIISSLFVSAVPILFLVNHNGGAGKKHVELYDNGNKKAEVFFKNGKMDGLFKGWYENGKKKSEKNFKDGKRDGSSVMWYENGQKMEEIMYKNDHKDGLETQWYENGNKKVEVTFRNDKLDGIATKWYKNGEKEFEKNFKNGEETGLGFTWYENGQKHMEANKKDGRNDGLVTIWYKNGQKMAEENFKYGKHEGLALYWHKNGQKGVEENYKDNKLVVSSAKYWNSKGEPVNSREEAESEK